MARSRPSLGLTPLTVAVVAVATPATLALSLYMVTGDARFRPLSQTIENTWLFPGDRNPLVAVISWPAHAETAAAENLAHHVRQAIKAKGIHAKVTVIGTDGPGSVIYQVGRNTIGPFPLAAAVEGIPGAVAAYWRQSGTRERDAI